MGSLIYKLFLLLFFPLLLLMLLVKKKLRLPLIFVLVGMFVAVFAADANGILVAIMQITPIRATVSLTPITEELFKALPILFFAIVVSDERETLFAAAMATGIGFAVMENAYYLVLNRETFSLFSALIRGVGTGLMHGMCTLLVGFGISFVRKKPKFFIVGTFALLTTAITYHAIFNMLVQSELLILGALLPIVTYVPFFIWRNVKKQKGEKKA